MTMPPPTPLKKMISSDSSPLTCTYNVYKLYIFNRSCTGVRALEHILLYYISVLFSSFFLYGKKLPYVVTRDVCPSVCPSSVEISLERGCSITNMPINLTFGTIIGGRVMHV